MSANTRPSGLARRATAREDLLTMAAAAEVAVGIVRQREMLPRRTEDEGNLFDLALKHQLGLALGKKGWAIKAQAWNRAAIIVRFSGLVGSPVACEFTPEQMHANALRELQDKQIGTRRPLPAKDLTLDIFNRYHSARDLRLTGRYLEARKLSMVESKALHGTGAESHMAHFLYETGASFLAEGRAKAAVRALGEWEAYWCKDRQSAFSTRYRFDLIRGLAQWELDTDLDRDRAEVFLRDAVHRVRGAAYPTALAEHQQALAEGDRGVQELSAVLALAEFLADSAPTEEACAEAVKLATQALTLAERVRGRWRVIARSRAPLAVVFQRLYGDIAILAARLPGRDAAELGLRVALSAKQTGFAARMRENRRLMTTRIEGIIDDIVAVENGSNTSFAADDEARREKLTKLWFQLKEKVSAMLADTVLPSPVALDELRVTIGDRYALDFLELPDTVVAAPNLFRTLIRPDGSISFEIFRPDHSFRAYFEDQRRYQDLAGDLRDLAPAATSGRRAPDWRDLADAVLPADFVSELVRRSDGAIELLISAHSWLSLVPWPALKLGDGQVRLVERAIITQCPVLTCLQYKQPPAVSGTALIRLVGRNEGGVNIAQERHAWGLPDNTEGLPVSECPIAPGHIPSTFEGTFVEALTAADRWSFLHIASHGGGQGLEQYLEIPEEWLTAGRALDLTWPASVLMASCHVGQVVNVQDAEPLNFVTALLTGGARCVVAGIASVGDAGTGEAASRIVDAIRAANVRLDVALRDAQLAAVRVGAGEAEWALLAAYIR